MVGILCHKSRDEWVIPLFYDIHFKKDRWMKYDFLGRLPGRETGIKKKSEGISV